MQLSSKYETQKKWVIWRTFNFIRFVELIRILTWASSSNIQIEASARLHLREERVLLVGCMRMKPASRRWWHATFKSKLQYVLHYYHYSTQKPLQILLEWGPDVSAGDIIPFSDDDIFNTLSIEVSIEHLRLTRGVGTSAEWNSHWFSKPCSNME